jgi:adenosylhomocysteine nucleosidase
MSGNTLVSLAVGAELAPWRRLRPFRRVRCGSSSFYQARVGHAEVLVILTGVGVRHAEVVTPLAIQYKPRAGVVAGVAAGLKPGLRSGDIVVAESVWNTHQTESVRSDPWLFECALECGAQPVHRLLSLERIVRTVEGKSRLAHAGDAAEMETLAVMQCLSCEGVPAVAVRAIADGAGEDVPCDFERTLDHLGQIRFSRLFLQLVRRPMKFAAFVQFGLSSRRATISLAHYLDRLVESLAGQDSFRDPALLSRLQ